MSSYPKSEEIWAKPPTDLKCDPEKQRPGIRKLVGRVQAEHSDWSLERCVATAKRRYAQGERV